MPISVNGTIPMEIIYNNTNLDKVICDGTTVWWKPLYGEWTCNTPSTRPWTGTTYDYAVTGTALGARSGGSYMYSVMVPIYHSSSNTNSYTARVYLSSSSGGTTIDLGTQSFTKSGIYSKSVEVSTWYGNRTTIYVRIVVSNSSYMTIDSNGEILVTCSSGVYG